MLPPVSVQRVLETCLYVDDLDQAEKFYSDLFGFELYGKQKERHVFFHCGEGMLLLFNARETQKANHGFPPHGATGPMHVAFEIDESLIPAWKERLNQKGISIEQEIIERDPFERAAVVVEPLEQVGFTGPHPTGPHREDEEASFVVGVLKPLLELPGIGHVGRDFHLPSAGRRRATTRRGCCRSPP